MHTYNTIRVYRVYTSTHYTISIFFNNETSKAANKNTGECVSFGNTQKIYIVIIYKSYTHAAARYVYT